MSRKKRDTSKKRASILDAAVQVFVDEGYESASMDRIAARASASKRTVYNHFESKEILFEAVIERFTSRSSEATQILYDPAAELEDQLRAFIDAKLAIAAEPSQLGLMRVAIQALVRDPESARDYFNRYEEENRALATWLLEARGDGRLDIADATLSATIFWSMVSGAISWPQILTGSQDERWLELLKDEIIQTFLSRYQR